jgi:hypothetical protein
MDPTQVTVEGTLQPDGTLVLDEKPDLPPGRVRVRMEAAKGRPVQSAEELMAVLRGIWARRNADGCPARTAEEVDTEIGALRDEAEERVAEIGRLQGERTEGLR